MTRPLPEREGPLRQPARNPSAALHSAPESAAPSPAESAIGAAYRVYDQYLEEGRRYAAGQSAWLNRQNRPSARLGGAVHEGAAGSLAPWVDLAAKVIPAIAAEIARRGGASAPLAPNEAPSRDAWRPWFGPPATQRESTIPASELQRRQPATGPAKR